MDEYWTGLAEFLAASPAAGFGATLAPRGVAEAIADLTAYDEWDRFGAVSRVVVHKGLVDEIPDGLLEGLFGTTRPSFASEVFVVYDVTPTKEEDVRAAEIALAEKANARVYLPARGGGQLQAGGKAADPGFVGIADWNEGLAFEQQFDAVFRPRLGKREEGFAALFQALAAHPRPLIVETGCLRAPGNWDGDGQSSFMFYALARERRGQFLSIDCSAESIGVARRACSSATSFICNDSVPALHALSRLVQGRLSLLYLDSFDVDFNNPLPSAVHHGLELTAAHPLTAAGTIVCVDDYGIRDGAGGKGLILDMFFAGIGAEVLYSGYQKIWRL
jgi:hypothetical protein